MSDSNHIYLMMSLRRAFDTYSKSNLELYDEYMKFTSSSYYHEKSANREMDKERENLIRKRETDYITSCKIILKEYHSSCDIAFKKHQTRRGAVGLEEFLYRRS